MDNDRLKDVGMTGVGGVSGVDLLYMAAEGVMRDGFDFYDAKLIFYGVFTLVAGFFAWKKQAVPASEGVRQ